MTGDGLIKLALHPSARMERFFYLVLTVLPFVDH
jgi:hypothetical protein